MRLKMHLWSATRTSLSTSDSGENVLLFKISVEYLTALKVVLFHFVSNETISPGAAQQASPPGSEAKSKN